MVADVILVAASVAAPLLNVRHECPVRAAGLVQQCPLHSQEQPPTCGKCRQFHLWCGKREQVTHAAALSMPCVRVCGRSSRPRSQRVNQSQTGHLQRGQAMTSKARKEDGATHRELGYLKAIDSYKCVLNGDHQSSESKSSGSKQEKARDHSPVLTTAQLPGDASTRSSTKP